jgi:very-short-patch-repair endonuclease
LLEALGDGWVPEFVVHTNVMRVNQQRLPNHFKIDIAYPERMLAIEVDGISHQRLLVRERDAKKERFLAENGWCLLRLLNEEILRDLDTALEKIRSKFLI